MCAAALTGIFAFGVLANNDPVEVTGAAILERRGGSAEDFGRAHVGVLLEGLADCEAEAPEGDVVRNVCGRDRYVCIHSVVAVQAGLCKEERSVPGAPTEPKRMASNFFSFSSPPGGM